MEVDQKYKKAFLDEASELIEKLNSSLLELEENPKDRELINELFRYTHSLKSESGLMGLSNISEIAHKMEDLLDIIRSKNIQLSKKDFDILFLGIDYIHEGINNLSKKWEDLPVNEKLISKFKSIIESYKNIEKEVKEKNKNTSSEDSDSLEVHEMSIDDLIGASKKEKNKEKTEEKNSTENYTFDELIKIFSLNEFQKSNILSVKDKKNIRFLIIYILESSPMKYPRAFLVWNNLNGIGEILATFPNIEKDHNDDNYRKLYIIEYFKDGVKEALIREACNVDEIEDVKIYNIIFSTQESEKKETAQILSRNENNLNESDEEQETSVKSLTDKIQKSSITSIRVDIERLDALSRHIGELIINKSKFIQAIEYLKSGKDISEIINYMEEAEKELDRITDDMQNIIMSLRMIPISNVFNKFPRVVRDIARRVGKDINLEIIGGDTEIDKKVIEEIQDPITHIIRNAIDHGIEYPDERKKLGKTPEGNVKLAAYQEGSNIIIEVSDDGRGIDKEKIREKAIKMGLISEFEPVHDNMLYSFLFLPGFSTKDKVTELSGRGVGLDVVKEMVEKLRGKVEINSEKSVGTNIRIILPLSLTILEILLVKSLNDYFAIPIYTIDQTDRVSISSIEKLEEYDIIRYRGEIYSVIFLSDLVGKGKHYKSIDDLVYIVIVKFNEKKICIVIDELIGEQDIVLQPLDNIFEKVKGISGVGLLGDGSIALVLNIPEIVREYIEKNARLFEMISENVDFVGFHDNIVKEGEKIINKSDVDNYKINNIENKNEDKEKAEKKEKLEIKKENEKQLNKLKNNNVEDKEKIKEIYINEIT
ncbi:MAG: chemotaxis protein CheA [Spirochaetes bacterium]|nr:chemotaxis protein CheA [Spirochaetota bacterium]